MTLIYIIIFGTTFLLGLSAVLALAWAGESGQFKDMKKGSESIFDHDEPVGIATDMVFMDLERKSASVEKASNSKL